MFGPYEVELDGHRYYGNVGLHECHTFKYANSTYLVDVDRHAAQLISPRVASLIGHLVTKSSLLVSESLMETLRHLKLVAGEEETHDVREPAAQGGAASPKTELSVVNIAMFLAQECNLRCLYCYGQAGEYAGPGMMDKDTAFRVVDWLMENSRSAQRVTIGFFGGEPLLNFPLMRDVVSYARQKASGAGKEMRFSITTNGTLLTDEIIAFLKEENIETLISFDGPPEIQNRQRPFKDGSGSYDVVRVNAARLRNALPRLTARATVYADADPVRIKEGMEQAGFSTCLLYPASPILLDGVGAPTPETQFGERWLHGMETIYRQEAEELLAAIRERRLVTDSPNVALVGLASLFSGQKRLHSCGVGKGMAGVTINGDIYPCHRFAGLTHFRMGNIADYQAGAINDYHRAIVDNLPKCRVCWARYYCGGGCFYQNLATTGDMHRASELDCRELQILLEGLIHVYCQLDEADREYVKALAKDF